MKFNPMKIFNEINQILIFSLLLFACSSESLIYQNNVNKIIGQNNDSFTEFESKTKSGYDVNGDGCVTWGNFDVTTYPDGSQEWELIYTYEVCDEDQSDDEDTGGGNGAGTSGGDDIGPDCKSFDFRETVTGAWQESAVKDIGFKVYIINPNGVKYRFSLNFPQPVLFGVPMNLNNGGDLEPGVAAKMTAEVLDKVMSTTAKHFYNKAISQLTVENYFKDLLKSEYPKYIPGGRVNFNSTNHTVLPTIYKTRFWGTGDCN